MSWKDTPLRCYTPNERRKNVMAKIETFGFAINKTLIAAAKKSESMASKKNDKLYLEIWYNLESGEVYSRITEDRTVNLLHRPSDALPVIFVDVIQRERSAQYIMDLIMARLSALTKFLPLEAISTIVDI